MTPLSSTKKKWAILPIILLAVSLAALKSNCNEHHPATTAPLKAVLNDRARPLPVYGFNGDNTHGPAWTDKAFRDSAAALDFKIIRYPGGSPGEYWDWRKGWFLDDATLARYNLSLRDQFTKTAYSPTSLAELKLLVDQTHCAVVFDLNMTSKELDDQIEMLNTAESLGIGVKYVELGNEYNVVGSPGMQKFSSPREYGKLCNTWIKAIKEKFPDVKIAVVGGNKPNPRAKDWNTEVLDEASEADAIVAHLYPRPQKVLNDGGINFENLYNAVEDEFDDEGFNATNKELWVTEFNVLWSMGKTPEDKTAYLNAALSWGQALSTIMMASLATTMPKKPQMILDHNISNWAGYAAIETQKKPLYTLPNGMGFRTWCRASNNHNTLTQIHFQQENKHFIKDFEVLGWQFSGETPDSYLIVNFTPEPVTIDVSALSGTNAGYYNLEHADKNKVISSWQDVIHEKKTITKSLIELPAYSISTF
jgi:hypothetical protein